MASRDGAVWKLTWDRAATFAFAPAKAVLSIRDGGNERRIDLGPTDRAPALCCCKAGSAASDAGPGDRTPGKKGQGANLQRGASFAAWSPDGHELLYQVGDQIMATIFELANGFQGSD